jgi:photosystem II stability/assembly factor-like uncharacterized protein
VLSLLFCLRLHAAWAPLGPFGGPAAVVVADPHLPKTFVAGTRNALLFRTNDAGESWSALPFPAQLRATLNALAIDPQTPGVYLAGLSSDLRQYSGMLRSTDGGASWQQTPDLRNEQVRVIVWKRANSKLVAAGTDSGVFESQDGGMSWTRISPAENSQLRPVVSLAFDPNDGAILYAGTPHLPWKTSDGGVSWHSISAGMIDDSDVFSIQPDRNRPQRVFASACSGIYRSLGGGAGWTRLAGAENTSSRTYVIVQDPQYENVWYAGATHGMVRSRDGGGTWERLVPFATRSIAFDPGRLGRIFIATDEAGILRSDDSGNTWQAVNKGFCNRRLSTLWTIGNDVYTAAPEDPGSGAVLRFPAGASEWEKVATAGGSAAGLTAMFWPPWSDGLVLAASGSGVWLSQNGGDNWKALDLPLPAARIRAFSALDPPWIAAVEPGGIFLSRDAKRWTRSFPLPSGEVYGLASTGGRRWIAATSGGLRASDDFGATWQSLGGALARDTVQAIYRPAKSPTVFAATYGVIYASRDNGRSWKRVSPDDWPVSSVKQLMTAPGSPDRLLILTPQQGVWELTSGDAAQTRLTSH